MADAQSPGLSDDCADGFRSGSVSFRSFKPPGFCPTPVAIHDNGYMGGQVFWGDPIGPVVRTQLQPLDIVV